MIWKSKNDTKFSGDEKGVGVIIDGKAYPLKNADRIYISDAAMRRGDTPTRATKLVTSQATTPGSRSRRQPPPGARRSRSPRARRDAQRRCRHH